MSLPHGQQTPIFASYCIDERYDELASEFLRQTLGRRSYYIGTNAGAALCLGYDASCRAIRCGGGSSSSNKAGSGCCPGTTEMRKLKRAFNTNFAIALTLKPITVVYLLNHQDCGAIRAFLPCSGYPAKSASDGPAEVCINARILAAGQRSVLKEFPRMSVVVGLLDANGTVANYDVEARTWTIVFLGQGCERTGLWHGRTLGERVTYDCRRCQDPTQSSARTRQQPVAGDHSVHLDFFCA